MPNSGLEVFIRNFFNGGPPQAQQVRGAFGGGGSGASGSPGVSSGAAMNQVTQQDVGAWQQAVQASLHQINTQQQQTLQARYGTIPSITTMNATGNYTLTIPSGVNTVTVSAHRGIFGGSGTNPRVEPSVPRSITNDFQDALIVFSNACMMHNISIKSITMDKSSLLHIQNDYEMMQAHRGLHSFTASTNSQLTMATSTGYIRITDEEAKFDLDNYMETVNDTKRVP